MYIFRIFRSGSYIKVIGSRSRSQEQKFFVGIAYQLVSGSMLSLYVRVACLWLRRKSRDWGVLFLFVFIYVNTFKYWDILFVCSLSFIFFSSGTWALFLHRSFAIDRRGFVIAHKNFLVNPPPAQVHITESRGLLPTWLIVCQLSTMLTLLINISHDIVELAQYNAYAKVMTVSNVNICTGWAKMDHPSQLVIPVCLKMVVLARNVQSKLESSVQSVNCFKLLGLNCYSGLLYS